MNPELFPTLTTKTGSIDVGNSYVIITNELYLYYPLLALTPSDACNLYILGNDEVHNKDPFPIPLLAGQTHYYVCKNAGMLQFRIAETKTIQLYYSGT